MIATCVSCGLDVHFAQGEPVPEPVLCELCLGGQAAAESPISVEIIEADKDGGVLGFGIKF